jgi:hypothetical protein
MQNAGYFRAQAELYFELARRMSVPSDAQYFRGNAERHLANAEELEAHPPVPARPARPATSDERGRRQTDVSPFGRT